MAEFHNPQNDPGMERRMLLAFALTFLAIVISQQLMSRYLKPAPPTRASAPPPSQTAATPATPSSTNTLPPATAATKQAASENETVVENDLYRITFTNRGAQAKSWILKKYKDDNGHPLDLVNQAASSKYGFPLSLWTYEESVRKKLNDSLFVGDVIGNLQAPGTVSFDYADPDITVHKSFTFDHSYVVKVETSVAQKGEPVQAYPAWPAGFGDQAAPATYAAERIDWHNGDKVTRVAAKKVSGNATISIPLYWGGAVEQYFAAIFLPEDPQTAALITLHYPLSVPKDPKKNDSTATNVSVLGAAVGSTTGVTRERLFVGPKNFEVLEQVRASTAPPASSGALNGGGKAPDLTAVVDFGWLPFIAKPLFLWLKWTEEHWVHNWGWSIAVLTVLINLALWPLRISSLKSSQKMQKIQPQIKAIQERYKKYKLTDPRQAEKNKEVQDLMKREGVNPAGGCLPMLMQMPFFIAFYSMLGNAIELRHAPWLWVADLSAPDPYHIIPIAIVASMFFLQRLTPQAGMDPSQQKMMTFMMPVMMGYLTWWLAAGVGVYWLLGNVLGGIQQLWMNNTQHGREMRLGQKTPAKSNTVKK